MVQLINGDNVGKRFPTTNSGERRPENTFEETAWWWNYSMDRAVSQTDNQQGHYNALNETWHVVWIPEWPGLELNLPQKWQRMPERTSNLPLLNQPTVVKNPTIVNKQSNTTPITPNQASVINEPENERIVTPDEFWIPQKPEEKKEPEQQENTGLERMQEQLNQSTEWKIYGKVTADQEQVINTLEDDNNIFKSMNDSRIQTFKNLQNMNSQDLATSIYYWLTPYGEQWMRDLMQFDPQKYQEVQQNLKKMYAQDEVNNISNPSSDWSWKTWAWSYVDSIDKNIDTDITNWEKNTTQSSWYEEVSWILDYKLSSNQTASSAKQEMMNIKRDIADLEQQLEDLPKLAPKMFKWDVPDYIYKAFIANNQQKIQSELSKLQSRYSWLSDIYKTEIANAQRELEYDLKKQEMNRKITNDSWDRYYKDQELELDRIKWGTDSKWNMIAFKIDPTTWKMYQINDGTAFATYEEAVDKTAIWAQSQVWKYTGLECTGFTNKISEGLAWVRMVWKNGAATAEEKVAYATNPSVSDYVPVNWDVAVMVNNGKNWVSSKWWHTMRVDRVYTDNNWDTWFHYIATNRYWKEKEYTYWYQWDMRVTDFYKNGWVWFWNPFKQAQYNNRGSVQTSGTSINPMENTIDSLINSWKLNATQTTNISKFGYAYENLWRSQQLGELNELLNEWAAARFFQQLAVSLANTQSWQNTKNTVWGAAKITLDEFIKQVEVAAWQEMWWWSSAYMWFMAIVWVIESKLRKESGAAINGSEWAMDFLQYLPQAWDTQQTMNRKLENLETFLKYWAKEWWITNDKYVPIFNYNTISNKSSSTKWKRFYF